MRAEQYWQALLPAGTYPNAGRAGDSFVVTLSDGRQLELPIRTLSDGTGLASLIVNQASFAVQRELVAMLAEQLRPLAPDIVVGLPTLGLTVASAVAEALGHSRYVPLGTSRKFWYDDALSVPLSSITTPEAKRLYVDPRLLPLLMGQRVVLIDDVLSTGKSIVAGLGLLRLAGVKPVAIGAVMLQSERWHAALPADAPPVLGVFATPLLERQDETWRVRPPA